MSTTRPAGFRRQVVVRIPADNWSLLEDAARVHGSQQAALLAGLRALAQQRHKPADDPAPRKPPTPEPPAPTADPDGWWVSPEFAAGFAGVKAATLTKRWAADGRAELRHENGEDEVRLDTLELERHQAAALLEVSSDTIKRLIESGRLGTTDRGYLRLGELLVPVDKAARYLDIRAAEVEALIARGDLPTRKAPNDALGVPYLDLCSHRGRRAQ